MALDSYRVRETRKPTENTTTADMKSVRRNMRELLDSLPRGDMDQEWVKENEVRENYFFNTNQKSDDEQPIFQNKGLNQRLEDLQSDITSMQQSYEQQEKEQDTIIEWEEIPQQPQLSPQTQETIVTYEEMPPQINQMLEQMQHMSNSTNTMNKNGRRM